MDLLDTVLGAAVAANASDVFLLEGLPPTLKVDGVAGPRPGSVALGRADLEALLGRIVAEPQRKGFEATGEANLSYMHGELGRFRVNCYRAMGALGMVLRRVKTEVPSFQALELPPLLGQLALERQGLLLVVGATGAGDASTTLAAMIDHRNAHSQGHVVTIEGPRRVHPPVQAERGLPARGGDRHRVLPGRAPERPPPGAGRDLRGGAQGRRHRGHRASLGGDRAPRLLDPPRDERHRGHRAAAELLPARGAELNTLMQLSLMVRAIVAQRLVPRAAGKGRVAAMEIMLNTPASRP